MANVYVMILAILIMELPVKYVMNNAQHVEDQQNKIVWHALIQ